MHERFKFCGCRCSYSRTRQAVAVTEEGRGKCPVPHPLHCPFLLPPDRHLNPTRSSSIIKASVEQIWTPNPAQRCFFLLFQTVHGEQWLRAAWGRAKERAPFSQQMWSTISPLKCSPGRLGWNCGTSSILVPPSGLAHINCLCWALSWHGVTTPTLNQVSYFNPPCFWQSPETRFCQAWETAKGPGCFLLLSQGTTACEGCWGVLQDGLCEERSGLPCAGHRRPTAWHSQACHGGVSEVTG